MTSFVVYVLAALMALSLAGCRQADGPMPVADEEVQNRLGDIARDLMSVAAREADAPRDFADDLRVFAAGPEGEQAARQLARRVADAVQTGRLTEQAAQRLAHNCWTAVAAKEMSERQVETLRNEMQGLLTSIGVPAQNAQAVTNEVGAVQKVVTTRQKRWYEVF